MDSSLAKRPKATNDTIWLFPKTRGPILVVPLLRIIVYLGLFWGPLFMETPILKFMVLQLC